MQLSVWCQFGNRRNLFPTNRENPDWVKIPSKRLAGHSVSYLRFIDTTSAVLSWKIGKFGDALPRDFQSLHPAIEKKPK